MEQEKRDSVKSLGKALQLIDIINQARTPMTLMRLSQVSGFPKSTVYALLNTLRSYDCIRQGSDGRYYLGMRLFEWGCGVSASWELNNVARPYLEKLAAHTDATALLSRIEGNSVVVIDQSTAMCGGIYVTTEIGTHLPLHATSQRKLLLAVILLPRQAQAAGIATDDLRIRVGYFGMDVDEYVDVDTYHWSQLESDLPLHRQAYTFLRNGDDGEYRVVDSAIGFYIDDLLAYANINISDVQSMNFYTRDQETGYFTSFSLAELLQSRRYYFEICPPI